MINNLLAIAIVTVFVVLALVHTYWAFGGRIMWLAVAWGIHCCIGSSCLTMRHTATGEKHRTSVNHLPRPRAGANVGLGKIVPSLFSFSRLSRRPRTALLMAASGLCTAAWALDEAV